MAFARARLAFDTSLSRSNACSFLRFLGSRSCRSKSSKPARARSRIASNSVIDSSHSPRFAILSRVLSLVSHIRRSLNSKLSSNHSSPSSAVILTIANTSSIGISHSVASDSSGPTMYALQLGQCVCSPVIGHWTSIMLHLPFSARDLLLLISALFEHCFRLACSRPKFAGCSKLSVSVKLATRGTAPALRGVIWPVRLMAEVANAKWHLHAHYSLGSFVLGTVRIPIVRPKLEKSSKFNDLHRLSSP